MSDTPRLTRRPLAVWLTVTTALASAWTVVGPSAQTLAAPRTWQATFEELLVAVAAATLVACLGWLWLVTTVIVAGLMSGRAFEARGLTRRLVLTACGIAVVAGVSTPALASNGSGDPDLAGLPLPDRAAASPAATASPLTTPAPRAAAGEVDHRDRITVRAGDSLWSIARAELGPGAELGEIDSRWRALYALNRGEIGPDPDLLRPGQELRQLSLPSTDHSTTDR